MGNDALADHLRAHAEKYPYLCTESEQTFSQTCDASSSAAPGSEAIPYKCKMCDKSFICELLKHLNQSDKRIYKCSICSKPFIHLDGHVFHRTKFLIEKARDGQSTHKMKCNEAKFPGLHSLEIPYAMYIKGEEDM